MRKAVGKAAVQTHGIHQFIDPVQLLRRRHFGVFIQRLTNDGGQRHAWVEAGLRVLEHHLHFGAGQAQCFGRKAGHINAVNGDRACSRFVQPQNRAPDSGFAAAAFADKAKGFAFDDIKADIINRFHITSMTAQKAGIDREVFLEVAH